MKEAFPKTCIISSSWSMMTYQFGINHTNKYTDSIVVPSVVSIEI